MLTSIRPGDSSRTLQGQSSVIVLSDQVLHDGYGARAIAPTKYFEMVHMMVPGQVSYLQE